MLCFASFSSLSIYSVDKVVSLILGRYAFLEYIYEEYVSYDGYDEEDKIDIVELQLNCDGYEKVGRFIENLFADEPFPIYRAEAILKDANGKLF